MGRYPICAKWQNTCFYTSQSQNKLACPICETGFLRKLSQIDPSYLQIPGKIFQKWVTQMGHTRNKGSKISCLPGLSGSLSLLFNFLTQSSHYRKHTTNDKASESPFQQQRVTHGDEQTKPRRHSQEQQTFQLEAQQVRTSSLKNKRRMQLIDMTSSNLRWWSVCQHCSLLTSILSVATPVLPRKKS